MRPSLFREARLERGLALEEVAGQAGLPHKIARHIDAGRLECLPPGVYARSFVRAFAGAVGLDPHKAIEAVGDDLPVEPDPFPLLREMTRARPPESVFMWAVGRMEEWSGMAPLARRYAAVCVDTLFLLGFSVWLTAMTAWFCGVDVPRLMQSAGGAMSVLCTVVWALYFLFSAIGGLTPGMWLVAGAPAGDGRRLTLPQVLRRTHDLWLEECSILVNLVADSRGREGQATTC